MTQSNSGAKDRSVLASCCCCRNKRSTVKVGGWNLKGIGTWRDIF
ncbi:MAG TPA: hypothetical protein VI278_06490 [Nitrososphaeraceae archaeon]